MLSREELEILVNVSDEELSHHERMGKKSAESRGLPYYGKLRNLYPNHFSSFSCMYARKKSLNIEISSTFSRDVNGFINFLLYLGDVQTETDSIGRIDHSQGYIEGNFRWQSLEENSKESVERNRRNLNKVMFLRPIYINTMLYLNTNINKTIHINTLYNDLKRFNKNQKKNFRVSLTRLGFIKILQYKDVNNFYVQVNEFDISKYVKTV